MNAEEWQNVQFAEGGGSKEKEEEELRRTGQQRWGDSPWATQKLEWV